MNTDITASAKKSIWTGLRVLLAGILMVFLIAADAPGKIPPELESDMARFNQVLSAFNNNYYEKVESRDEIYAAIAGMLSTLDPHTVHLPPDFFEDIKVDIQGEFGGLGIEVGMRDNQLTVISPIEDTPAWRAGIQALDKIVAIDGEPTSSKSLNDCVHKMRGKIGAKVTISIMRKGWSEPQEFTITREKIQIKSVKKAEKVGDNIGYLRIATFNENTEDEVVKGLGKIVEQVGGKKSLRGLILDLRDNPGGPLDQAVKVADNFISSGTIVSIRGRHAEQTETRYAHSSGTFEGFPMIVLVNGGSASASEIVAGALRDHSRAVIMGTKSFGKGSVQTLVRLKDGSGLKMTTAYYYTPSNRSIQEVGITPDVVVEKLSPEQMSIVDKYSQKKARVREVDLEGHFDQDDVHGAELEQDQDTKLTEDEKKVMSEDYQLKRAIEMFKSWNIFQADEKNGKSE